MRPAARCLVVAVLLVLVSGLPVLDARSQSNAAGVTGTWEGPVHCLHGGGDRFTMTIDRTADGKYSGTMDWALATSDGQRGPGRPFTTLLVDGTKITATATAAGRTARLEAVVDGDAISGEWRITGNDDIWTFTGMRR